MLIFLRRTSVGRFILGLVTRCHDGDNNGGGDKRGSGMKTKHLVAALAPAGALGASEERYNVTVAGQQFYYQRLLYTGEGDATRYRLCWVPDEALGFKGQVCTALETQGNKLEPVYNISRTLNFMKLKVDSVEVGVTGVEYAEGSFLSRFAVQERWNLPEGTYQEMRKLGMHGYAGLRLWNHERARQMHNLDGVLAPEFRGLALSDGGSKSYRTDDTDPQVRRPDDILFVTVDGGHAMTAEPLGNDMQEIVIQQDEGRGGSVSTFLIRERLTGALEVLPFFMFARTHAFTGKREGVDLKFLRPDILMEHLQALEAGEVGEDLSSSRFVTEGLGLRVTVGGAGNDELVLNEVTVLDCPQERIHVPLGAWWVARDVDPAEVIMAAKTQDVHDESPEESEETTGQDGA